MTDVPPPPSNETSGFPAANPKPEAGPPLIGSLISEGVLLGAITLTGYACAYIYESSFAEYFGVPRELFTLPIERVIAPVIAVLGAFLGIGTLVEVLSEPFMKVDAVVSTRIMRTLPILLMFVLPLIGYRAAFFQLRGWPYMLGLAAFLLARQFLFPLFGTRHIKGYAAKLRADSNVEASRDSLLRRGMQVLGYGPWLGVLIAINMFAASHYFGHGAAIRQERFLVPTGKDDWVVVYMSGDTVVLRGLDRQQRILDKRLALMKVSDSFAEFQWEAIGRVKDPDVIIP